MPKSKSPPILAPAAADSLPPKPRVLPSAESLWRSLTTSIDGFVCVLDRDLRLQFLNRSDVGHLAAEKLTGLPMTDFIVPEQRDRVRRILQEVFTTGKPAAYEVEGLNPRGERASYSVRASAVTEDGAVVAVVTTAIDARLLHETERALRAERQTLQQMLRTQERERQVVSYEIHDGLAQYQAGAIMQLESCLHGLEACDDQRLDHIAATCTEALELMRAAATEARRLINGLRPPMLDELGIEEAVQSLVDQAQAGGTAVDYVHPKPLRRLDPDIETAVFRIVQESLSNVRKHAAARHVRVALEPQGRENLAVSIKDDGIGFDLKSVPPNRFGLEGIRQRARLFGCEATITSSPGAGTGIDVTLPRFPAMKPAGTDD